MKTSVLEIDHGRLPRAKSEVAAPADPSMCSSRRWRSLAAADSPRGALAAIKRLPLLPPDQMSFRTRYGMRRFS